jgi:hypothetical protein
MLTEPILDFTPPSYSFGVMQEGESDTTSFEIWNAGAGQLNYSLSVSESWVSVSPLSGNSTGEHDAITVEVDTTGLPSGSFQDEVLIDSNSETEVFTVSLMISDASEEEDINQSLSDRGFRVMPGWDGAQEFIPSYTSISRLELFMSTWGDPWGPVTLEICEGGPDGVVVFSDTISDDVVPSFPDFGWVSVDVPLVSVDVGETYVVVLRDGDLADSHNCLMWGWCDSFGGSGPYPGGEFLFRKLDYSTWLPIHDWDFAFRTIGYN